MRLITEEELAAVTIWQEARNEEFNGKVAVGAVIRNRMAKKIASDGSVSGTVLTPLQFSGWNTKDPNRLPAMRLDDTDPAYRECLRAWIVSGATDPTLGATDYYNPSVCSPGWAEDYTETVVIGHHRFLTREAA